MVGAWSAPAGAATSASTLYKDALATTKAWSVHYASDAIISKVPILESGDAGPASGTQVVLVGTGAMTDNASLIVIGDITYLRGMLRPSRIWPGCRPPPRPTMWAIGSSFHPTTRHFPRSWPVSVLAMWPRKSS